MLITHTIKRPGKKPSEQPKIFKDIVEEGQLPYRESAHQVQISKHCVPKFKVSKSGLIRVGPLTQEHEQKDVNNAEYEN